MLTGPLINVYCYLLVHWVDNLLDWGNDNGPGVHTVTRRAGLCGFLQVSLRGPCQHRIRMMFSSWNLNMFRLKRVSWKSFVFNKVVIFHGILRQDTCVVMWFGWEQPLLVLSFIFHFQTSKGLRFWFRWVGKAKFRSKAGRRSSTSMTTPWWDFVTSCTPLRIHTYYTSFTMEIPWNSRVLFTIGSYSEYWANTEPTFQNTEPRNPSCTQGIPGVSRGRVCRQPGVTNRRCDTNCLMHRCPACETALWNAMEIYGDLNLISLTCGDSNTHVLH